MHAGVGSAARRRRWEEAGGGSGSPLPSLAVHGVNALSPQWAVSRASICEGEQRKTREQATGRMKGVRKSCVWPIGRMEGDAHVAEAPRHAEGLGDAKPSQG